MEKSWDLESQIAKVEENLVLILESINKDKEEVIPEGKRLDLEARLDFVEKLVRKIKAVGFNITDENQNQYSSFNKLISKKLGKLRIECAADQEEKEDQIKVMKEQFEEFTLKFEKQIEDQQKVNEELKKQLGEFEKKQKKLDQYLAASRRPITTAELGNIWYVSPTGTSTPHLGNIRIERDIEVESRQSRVDGDARPIKRLYSGSAAAYQESANNNIQILQQAQQQSQPPLNKQQQQSQLQLQLLLQQQQRQQQFQAQQQHQPQPLPPQILAQQQSQKQQFQAQQQHQSQPLPNNQRQILQHQQLAQQQSQFQAQQQQQILQQLVQQQQILQQQQQQLAQSQPLSSTKLVSPSPQQ